MYVYVGLYAVTPSVWRGPINYLLRQPLDQSPLGNIRFGGIAFLSYPSFAHRGTATTTTATTTTRVLEYYDDDDDGDNYDYYYYYYSWLGHLV